MLRYRPVARIFFFFFWGGGYVPQEPGTNILMFEWYAMQVPKIHRAEWQTYWVTEFGTSFSSAGNTCERRRREPLGGSGGMPCPGKFSNLKALKCHFQHSQAESCVKMVPKIDCYFLLNLTKKSVVIRCNIFTPLLMLAKYDTSFLRRTKKCSVVLSSVHLRFFPRAYN